MDEAKIYEDLIGQRAKLAVIGLGYVGLPIALEFAKKISVIGFVGIDAFQKQKKPSFSTELPLEETPSFIAL